MENPQKENGYVAVANEIYDALARTRIPGEARQCLDVIIRKTYGFNKKEDFISLSQFALFTGLSAKHCSRAIQRLLSSNLVTIPKKGYRGMNMYRFNKDYSTWRLSPKKEIVETTIPKIGTRLSPKKGDTKDNITKDKNTLSASPPNPPEGKESPPSGEIQAVIGLFKDLNPSYARLYPNKSERAAVERLLALHGKDSVEKMLKELVYWRTAPFCPVITKPTEFENKFAKLELFLRRQN